MNRMESGVFYSQVPIADLIDMLARRVKAKTEGYGSLSVTLVSKYPPDYLELRVEPESEEYFILLKCHFRPVYSIHGLSVYVVFVWEAKWKNPSSDPHWLGNFGKELRNSARQGIENGVAHELVAEILGLMRSNGAREAESYPLQQLGNVQFVSNLFVNEAIEVVSKVASKHWKKFSKTGAFEFSWQGTVVWCSPRTGIVAAILVYASNVTTRTVDWMVD